MRYSDKVWDPKNPEVPVDKEGNWLSYPSYEHVAWEAVTPFSATMVIDGMQTGRSSKLVILKNEYTDKKYPMFVADLVKSIQDGTVDISNKKLSGVWTASKRGANYGIKTI